MTLQFCKNKVLFLELNLNRVSCTGQQLYLLLHKSITILTVLKYKFGKYTGKLANVILWILCLQSGHSKRLCCHWQSKIFLILLAKNLIKLQSRSNFSNRETFIHNIAIDESQIWSSDCSIISDPNSFFNDIAKKENWLKLYFLQFMSWYLFWLPLWDKT